MSRHKDNGCKVTEEQLRSWSLLGEFRALLGKAPVPSAGMAARNVRKGGPARLLLEEDYLCAFLFAQFNPIIDSMRGLCACSRFPKVLAEVCSRPISLGSFSEAQGVFGFARLEKVFGGLAADRIRDAPHDGKVPPQLLKRLRLVDSSVFHAVPRMAWAHWRSGQRKGSAVRLHLKFRVLDGIPDDAVVSTAKVCERTAFETMIEPGEFYVGDRNYGRDYKLLKRMGEAGCGYAIRLLEQAVTTTIEELPLGEEDREAGVVSDRIVRLGAAKRWYLEPVRVIRIEKSELDEPVIIVTNQLDPKDMGARLVGDIYRSRWEIELFFRWLKCVFGRPRQWHWFAESPEGVGIQFYTALIASLLLAKRLGKLPTKRMAEALRWHQAGMVSGEELARALGLTGAKNGK